MVLSSVVGEYSDLGGKPNRYTLAHITRSPVRQRKSPVRSGKATVKATEKKSTGRSRTTEQRTRLGVEPVTIPLIEFDASRVAIIEPARINQADRHFGALRTVLFPEGDP
jgi:hypothetical protein